MNIISLENLNYYTNYFNKLKKADLKFEINKTEKSTPGDVRNPYHYQIIFFPKFESVKNLSELVNIWGTSPSPISVSSLNNPSFLSKPSCTEIGIESKNLNSLSVKYYANSVLNDSLGIRIFVIDRAVPEVTVNQHIIRYCVTDSYYDKQLAYCADESDAAFNYIDNGHVIIYVAGKDVSEDSSRMFVTDAITLDMNYIIAAASVYPPALDNVLQHKAYLPSKDCRLQLLRVEKAIPSKLRPDYIKIKSLIEEDFRKNTSSIMVNKLTKKECKFIDLNGIRISNKRADYTAGGVSIEANNLAEVVFSKLNPNETEWDIFVLINIYTDWINDQFKNLPLNTAGTGFLEEKTFSFKINDIPLTVGCSTRNTRRIINGHLINVDELSPVLRRAACYPVPEDKTEEDNKVNFDRFLTNVSRYSLKLRDVWANGMPVKTVFLESDRTRYNTPATIKHPKLRFIHKDKKGFFLQVNQLDPKNKTKIVKTSEYHISKFAEFIQKVESMNKHTNMGYHGDYTFTADGFYVPKSDNVYNRGCGDKLIGLLGIYANGITEEDKKSIVGTINYELSEAEKRSEEMLKEACELTGAKLGERAGKKGYVVPGKMRTYFIEEEGQMKVWNNDPKAPGDPYFCVVNKGEQGAGRDALISRIFAVHNDSMMAKYIHTLNKKDNQRVDA